jgi:hypothetical protein
MFLRQLGAAGTVLRSRMIPDIHALKMLQLISSTKIAGYSAEVRRFIS